MATEVNPNSLERSELEERAEVPAGTNMAVVDQVLRNESTRVVDGGSLTYTEILSNGQLIAVSRGREAVGIDDVPDDFRNLPLALQFAGGSIRGALLDVLKNS